jgi:DNA-binding protein HU-beta
MNRRSLARACRAIALPLCLLLGSGIALAVPAAASAAGSIYWANGETIETGTVAPASGASAAVLYEKLSETDGLALDPAAGTLYWSESGAGDILDGAIAVEKPATTGTTLLTGATGVGALSVGAAASKLYWGNVDSGDIFSGSLTATGGAALVESHSGVNGIAVDASKGKIYWANFDTGDIYEAPIAGGASKVLYEGLEVPEAVAIDAKTEQIFWTENEGEAIFAAPLAGGPGAKMLYGGESELGAIAVDPATGGLYWAAAKEIVAGDIEGEESKSPTNLYPTTVWSDGIALLDAPTGTGVPVASTSGTPAVGSTLSCTEATWAADLPESQLYQAPTSYAYQWLREGTALTSGGTSSTLKVSEYGTYTCEVTATNAAGSSAPQKSTTSVVVPAPAPSVSISSPTSTETTFFLNETVATKFSCKEGAGGPGIESCVDGNGVKGSGTASTSGGPIVSESGAGSLRTGSLGAHTYTVTVTLKDKQTATATFTYTIEPDPIVSFPEVTIGSIGKKLTSGKVAAKIACEPGEACSGKLKLTTTAKAASTKPTTAKAKNGKKSAAASKAKSKSKKLTLATGSYKLAGGKSETVQLKLSSAVLKTLEQSKKRTIAVTLEATVTNGTPATLSGKLTIPAAKASKAKKGKAKKSSGKK